jgi:hypothetical protein
LLRHVHARALDDRPPLVVVVRASRDPDNVAALGDVAVFGPLTRSLASENSSSLIADRGLHARRRADRELFDIT